MPQQVKTYHSAKDMEKDAKKLMKKGWSVVSQDSSQPRAGIGRIGLLGPMALLFKPKREIVVIYQKPD